MCASTSAPRPMPPQPSLKDGKLAAPAVAPGERISTVLLDLEGILYVGQALTMRFHTDTDSVIPPRLATARADSTLRPPRPSWTPRSVPKELTVTATPTAAQVMDSGLC